MQRIDVKSSLLKAIGYDAASRTLMIEFKPKKEGEEGKVYTYADVSPDTYKRFMASPSLGSHFLSQIKNHHSCTRVETEKPDAESEKKADKPRPFNTETDSEPPF